MDKQLLSLLFAGGSFPTGSFSHSWGLETYISDNAIKNAAELSAFLDMYIKNVIGRFEGPYFLAAYDAAGRDLSEVALLDREFTAMKLTKESREASKRTGKSFLRIAAGILDNKDVIAYYDQNSGAGVNYPIAFSLVCSVLAIGRPESLKAFIFSEVNSMVQSGLKLIPLGNMQAQQVLLGSLPIIEESVRTACATELADAGVFCPGLDIASARHETLQTRLYMS